MSNPDAFAAGDVADEIQVLVGANVDPWRLADPDVPLAEVQS